MGIMYNTRTCTLHCCIVHVHVLQFYFGFLCSIHVHVHMHVHVYTCKRPGGRAREIAQLRATFRRDSARYLFTRVSATFRPDLTFCANVQTKNGEIVRQRQLAHRRCESRFLCAKRRYSARSPACARAGTSAILPGPTFKGVPVARREP